MLFFLRTVASRKINKIEDYSFFKKNEIVTEAKKNIFELYINRTIQHLETYPMSDELFFFNEIKNYILKTRKFNSTWYYTYIITDPEIVSFNYDKFIKIEVNKLRVINVKIELDYCFTDEFSYINYCFQVHKICYFKDIIINKTNIIYGEFDDACYFEDEMLLKSIIDLSIETIKPFL